MPKRFWFSAPRSIGRSGRSRQFWAHASFGRTQVKRPNANASRRACARITRGEWAAGDRTNCGTATLASGQPIRAAEQIAEIHQARDIVIAHRKPGCGRIEHLSLQGVQHP